MSWKSLVSAGLLCVLATPAFALPQLEIVSGGLNAQGNWVWNVRVAPTAAGTPLSAELGFASNKNLVGVSNATAATWDTNVAGNGPTAWSGWLPTHGTPAKPEGLSVNCTGCSVTNAAALPAGGFPTSPVVGTLNQIFAALGSKDLVAGDLSLPAGTTINASTGFLQIVVAGPTNAAGNQTSSITLNGGYDGANASGRISEISSPATNSTNYKGFTGVATRTLQNADINLDGTVNASDFSAFGANWQASVTNGWAGGDFNRDGVVNASDFSYFGANWQGTGGAVNTPLTKTGVLDTPGAGSGLGAGSAVPEPASIALLGLALLGGLGLVGRKR